MPLAAKQLQNLCKKSVSKTKKTFFSYHRIFLNQTGNIDFYLFQYLTCTPKIPPPVTFLIR